MEHPANPEATLRQPWNLGIGRCFYFCTTQELLKINHSFTAIIDSILSKNNLHKAENNNKMK